MKTDYIQWLIEHGADHQVRYDDYEKDQFTVRVQLTKKRAKKLLDHSIVEVRFFI